MCEAWAAYLLAMVFSMSDTTTLAPLPHKKARADTTRSACPATLTTNSTVLQPALSLKAA